MSSARFEHLATLALAERTVSLGQMQANLLRAGELTGGDEDDPERLRLLGCAKAWQAEARAWAALAQACREAR